MVYGFFLLSILLHLQQKCVMLVSIGKEEWDEYFA